MCDRTCLKIEEIDNFIESIQKKSTDLFSCFEKIALHNQQKVLAAFRQNKIALRHFSGSSGYAYDDIGREALSKVFAHTFNKESAIVSPLFGSGTHTIAVALFGLTRPNDTILSISGKVYDTLQKVIKGNCGSLNEYGIKFESVNLTEQTEFDFDKIKNSINKYNPSIVYIQRAKGYEWRKALTVGQINEVAKFIKKITDASIIVDNCYGEFTEFEEPDVNLIMGSLIKNPGGGFALTGGYIAGDRNLIEKIGSRYSAPGLGFDIGANPYGYQYYFQGFFMAPHVVLQAMKAAALFSEVFSTLGYKTLGAISTDEISKSQKPLTQSDITCAIKFNSAEELIKFCQSIQAVSPVDSHVVPVPSPMPGYKNEVIMASGSFVQGSSIELSADAPIREPYIAYFQGGLTYEHAKIALKEVLLNILK
ncbi:MAG: methionine gamma-lyase family protein [Firmicutes bacterium]|nr:methionine gamma-lyase family protein [Bacillota bacterium]